MDNMNKQIRDSVAKPYFNKHVTTACNACRMKRCKCNGQTPCLPCSTTGDLCVYDRKDQRRQRHRKNADDNTVNQRTVAQISVEDAVDVAHQHDDDNKIQRDSLPGMNVSPTTQENERNHVTGLEIGTSDGVAATLPRDHQTKTTSFSGEKGDRSNVLPESKVHTMKEMQGKFETRAGPFRLQHHKLLPKLASTSQIFHSTRKSKRKHGRPDDQQEPRQFMWQLARKGFPVPGYTRTFGNLPYSCSIKANGYPADVQALQSLNFSASEHLIFPLVALDESPLGRALTDFQRLGRRLMAEGAPPSQVADQGLVDVTLFFRNRLPKDAVNASTWASEMLRTFRGTFSDALLLACAVCVARLMRWFLVPTAENYADLPSIARPTRLQRSKPHPPWVDLMIFPSFRNALVNNVRDWIEPCIKAKWEVLWPHSLEEALIYRADTEQVFLTPEFAAYIDDPKNWLMQRSILEDFSEIQATEINISQK